MVALIVVAGYGLWYLFLRPAGPPPISPGITGSASRRSARSGCPVGRRRRHLERRYLDRILCQFDQHVRRLPGPGAARLIGANTAVGRTPNVTGTMTISGTQLTAATITADLTALQSDDQRRDGQLVDHGLETSTLPDRDVHPDLAGRSRDRPDRAARRSTSRRPAPLTCTA